MKLLEKIKKNMYVSMKAGEKSKANTLRGVLAKLKDKKIEKRDNLTDQEEIKIIQTLVKQRKESIEMYNKGGRSDLAAIEEIERKILNEYLPKMMSEVEIQDIVKIAIDKLGVDSMADMGKIMPEVMKQGKGLIDGKLAQKFVQEYLG